MHLMLLPVVFDASYAAVVLRKRLAVLAGLGHDLVPDNSCMLSWPSCQPQLHWCKDSVLSTKQTCAGSGAVQKLSLLLWISHRQCRMTWQMFCCL